MGIIQKRLQKDRRPFHAFDFYLDLQAIFTMKARMLSVGLFFTMKDMMSMKGWFAVNLMFSVILQHFIFSRRGAEVAERFRLVGVSLLSDDDLDKYKHSIKCHETLLSFTYQHISYPPA
jgi:hypothetical protein